MRALLQRVKNGGVYIAAENYEQTIGNGFVILLGIAAADTESDVRQLVDKCVKLRVFEDENGKMNINIQDTGGEFLVISQFTLYADTRRGNRPNFSNAARPDTAIPLYELFIRLLRETVGADRVKTGIFGAMMDVTIINDGPVTIMLESDSEK